MTGDRLASRSPSGAACYVFAYLHRRGGSQRVGPLLRGLGINERAFVDAVNELAERYWISVVWHNADPSAPDDEPRPLHDVYRLCTTRFGRQKYRATWPTD